jgi:hypothetical protein
MALPVPIPGVQNSHALLGPGQQIKSFLIVPGTSDYVTGGYVLTCAQLGFNPTYGIQQAWISGANATAVATWNAVPVITFSQIGGVSTGAGFEGYTQILFYVYVLSTGSQAGSGANLTGAIWQLTVIGQ